MASTAQLIADLNGVIDMTETVTRRPENGPLRRELAGRLDLDAWPFRAAVGADEAFAVRVEDAREAAHIVCANLMTGVSLYSRRIDDLLTALLNLRHELTHRD